MKTQRNAKEKSTEKDFTTTITKAIFQLSSLNL